MGVCSVKLKLYIPKIHSLCNKCNSYESLVTAQPHTKVLKHAQNQTLSLITGAVKTTPIDAMTFITGNKPI